jgi:nucleoside-diphosphate-sugar epimerase
MLDLSGINSLLITGTNGFVGRSVIDHIASLDRDFQPARLLLLTRYGLNFSLPGNLSERSTVLEGDLTEEWMLGQDVSHVVNLAADGSKSPYSLEASNIFSSIVSNLVSWISTFQDPPRVFHASSGACSGYVPMDVAKEFSNPKTSFVQNRLESERNLERASSDLGFELSIGRLFTFAGSHLTSKNQYAISNFINSAKKSKLINVTGDPETVRSYMHQDTLAKWILTALVSQNLHTDLQIGSGQAVTIRELAEFIAECTSSDIDYASEPTPGDIYLPNNEETRDKLRVTEGKSWKLSVLEMLNLENEGE